MATQPEDDPRGRLRASDADRQAVIEHLQAYFAEGRLTEDEFEDRTARTYASRTYGDLWQVTRDLPAPRNSPATSEPEPPAAPAPPRRPAPHRRDEHVSRFATRMAVINLFLVAIWALSGGGYFWPIWPIMSCALVVGLKAVGGHAHASRHGP